MFNFKAVLLIVIVGAVLMHETEAHPKLKLKLKLLKAKLVAPHIAAKVAVAKSIKAKTAIAAAKTVAAIKAKKAAALAIITAPIQVAKKSLLIKAKKVKAVKAIKVATIAHAAAALKLKKLKKPLILPVPVPVPSPFIGKGFDFSKSLGLGLGDEWSALDAPAAVDAGEGPIRGLISGAQRLITTAGSALPGLSTLSNGIGASISKSIYKGVAPAPAPVVVAPAPIYRFVPEIGFANYNTASYQPQVHVEVPHPHIQTSSQGETIPAGPHHEYGVPQF